MIVRCENDRVLYITDIKSVISESFGNLAPCVVMLTAWSKKDVKEIIDSGLIDTLLVKGSINFVCFGDFSEFLHDEIDERIYQIEDENESDLSSKILTTFHSEDEIDDSLSYYLLGTELGDKTKNCLLAIFRGANNSDTRIKSMLKTKALA